jgi:prevent-host-death family protein
MDAQPHSSVKKINAMEARRNFGTHLEMVYYSGEQFIIERAGKPMAALVPISVLDEWQTKSSPAKTGPDTGKENKRQSHKRRA